MKKGMFKLFLIFYYFQKISQYYIYVNISIYIFCNFRLKVFRTLLYKLFQQQRAQSLPLSRVREYINNQQSQEFTSNEISAAINKMSDANQIMVADDNIFLM